MAVCKKCHLRTAHGDTEICPTCEAALEVYAAQASNQTKYFVTLENLTQEAVKQLRFDGWELLSGDFSKSTWCMDLSNLKTGSAA